METHPTAPVARSVKGLGWFAAVVALWAVFFTLAVESPGSLEAIQDWIRDLPLVLELGVWLLFFPWVLALTVWESGWAEWLRVALVVLFTVGWTAAFKPRAR